MKSVKMTTAKTAALVAVLTLMSKFIGFMREVVLANYFGAGMVTDAYNMAQSIPSYIMAALLTAVGTAYMPVFAQKYENEGPKEANKFTSQLINFELVCCGALIAVGLIFAKPLVSFFAPGFDAETASLTVFYLRIAFIVILANIFVGTCTAFLEYKGVFIPQVIIGYIQSACIIVVTIISAYTTHYLLAFGAALGFVIRGALVFWRARKEGYKYTADISFGPVVKATVAMAIPIFIGGSVNQINAMIDRFLASGLAVGSISALNYGNLVVGVIGALTVSVIATIIYPKLNLAFAQDDFARISNLSERSINLSFLITVPFMLGALVYGESVIQILYERGAFDTSATSLTAAAFICYAPLIVTSNLNTLITKVFYSLHDTKTPVICGMIAVVINIVLNLILVRSMAHAGLALATSIAQLVNAVMLYVWFSRKYPQIKLLSSARKFFGICLFSAVSVGTSYVFWRVVGAHIWMPRMVLLGLAVLVACGIYLLLLQLFKFEELDLLKQLVKRD